MEQDRAALPLVVPIKTSFQRAIQGERLWLSDLLVAQLRL